MGTSNRSLIARIKRSGDRGGKSCLWVTPISALLAFALWDFTVPAIWVIWVPEKGKDRRWEGCAWTRWSHACFESISHLLNKYEVGLNQAGIDWGWACVRSLVQS